MNESQRGKFQRKVQDMGSLSFKYNEICDLITYVLQGAFRKGIEFNLGTRNFQRNVFSYQFADQRIRPL